ncbi:hydrogenase maturation nickel metallochaperone HypA [Zavarzinia compransoris]|uniref:Hydrogenase maturation factor HypA n=1 Tax=Zavarzinia compransoris TaxID=1264899 RepID=A0A317ED35_9PROT|nr:hydrogenase maturation nickel metallochaperone HypA [Zavarzinia compransoris]PWR23125.1 hydrogenase maturation nickel metallochaperone HypA [Zavarzinia compransoris]TDP46321.1 hydrogenase-3 nickel incorporation protein HypA [Zavarzinia compransoris]
MHELSITRNIVAIVGEAAKGRPVGTVTLEIGMLSGVLAEAIAFCFEIVAEGTAAEGARLDIRQVPGRARCGDCGQEFDTPDLFTPCPCGSRNVTRIAGEELKIRSIELKETA